MLINDSSVLESTADACTGRNLEFCVVLEQVVSIATRVRERCDKTVSSLRHGEGAAIDGATNVDLFSKILTLRVVLEVFQRIPLQKTRTLPCTIRIIEKTVATVGGIKSIGHADGACMVLALRDVDLPRKALIMPVVKLPAILIGRRGRMSISFRDNLAIGHGNRKRHRVIHSETQIFT